MHMYIVNEHNLLSFPRKTFEVDYTASYRLDLHVNDLLSNLIGISNYTVLVILESKHCFVSPVIPWRG